MHIPACQIHNVLNTCSLKLFKAGSVSQNADSGSDTSASRMSPETRRKALIDKAAAEIVHRNTRLSDAKAAAKKFIMQTTCSFIHFP